MMPDISFTVEKLREITRQEQSPEELFSPVIQEIAQFYMEVFDLEDTEVAIFLCNEEKSILSFAYPEHLVDAGMIPVSSSEAVVSMIFRTQRSFIDNNFSQQKHLSIFEQIRIPGKKSLPIWKLMGTLITLIDDNIGVIELSRRSQSYAEAGRDFTNEDIEFLKMTLIQLAPFIRKVMPKDFKGKLT
jgi:hypothetical protein